MLLALTGLMVQLMGRFEEPRPDGRQAPAAWKLVAAAAIGIAGLAGDGAGMSRRCRRGELVLGAAAGGGVGGLRGGADSLRIQEVAGKNGWQADVTLSAGITVPTAR